MCWLTDAKITSEGEDKMFGNPKLALRCPGQEGSHVVNTIIPPADEGSALMHSEGCCISLGWKNDVFSVLIG